jgi:hypothetical protein
MEKKMNSEEKIKIYAGILQRVMNTLEHRIHSIWAKELLLWITKELEKLA